jgi:hypothetical protein
MPCAIAFGTRREPIAHNTHFGKFFFPDAQHLTL